MGTIGAKMKIYKTEKEMMNDVVNGSLVLDCDVKFEFDIAVKINITAWDIDAGDIDVENINAENIDAWNITARNINAWDILYYAFCCVYKSIKCFSIKAKRKTHQVPVCLGGELEIMKRSKDE